MAKKNRHNYTKSVPSGHGDDRPATLKDLLGADTLAKLKEQANELKEEEKRQVEHERQKKEEERKAEQRRLDNDFKYLLEHSDPNWHKYK